MFKTFKTQVQQNFKKLAKGNLFYVTIDRDLIFETYLNGFEDAEERQGHDCNCCKSFLRQWGGIVAIDSDYNMVSIWDFEGADGLYEDARRNLSSYIHSLSITDVFVNEYLNCGTDNNFDMIKNVSWNHFFIKLPNKFVKANTDAVRGTLRNTRQMLKRGLDELSIEATETVLELIAQNSLYRGTEFKPLLKSFLKAQKSYKDVPEEDKEHYTWTASVTLSTNISKVRNTAIGTLLVNLSEGMELDTAVSKYEKVVAPTNYKRPTALVTPSMIAAAKLKLEELGLTESLDRRFATEADLNINNLLFIDKTTANLDVFGEMTKESPVNPKTLTHTEEITIDAFIKNIVPTSKSIEILVENSHLSNLVSMVTSNTPDTPSLFKWNNNFSWAYTGNITDTLLRDEVSKLGGRVDGVFRFSHSWNEIEPNRSLMDLHVFMPGCVVPTVGGGPNVNGRRVGWNKRVDESGGNQDVDFVVEAPLGKVPVENITFPSVGKMPEGVYVCKIHNWSFRKSGGKGKAEIEVGGAIYQYEYPRTKNHQWITVAEVTLKNKVFTIKHILPESSGSKEKWNVKTNLFHKVDKMMLSPNYWDASTGNKHYFFMLKGCKADETPRPFFNEFLKPEFTENRKVFEIVGSKLKIEATDNQLSGLGFSETQRGHIIVRVEGKFKRTLKVNI